MPELLGLSTSATDTLAQASAPSGRVTSAHHRTTLVVENMHCGGCIKAVERALTSLPGVDEVRANLSQRRITIESHSRDADQEAYVAALASAGFKAGPLVEGTMRAVGADDPDLLCRLGVAGFGAANIMLLSVAVWAGQAQDMPPTAIALFHWLSALIAMPTIAYAGQPFFISARAALSAGRLNMDVPISLGVLLAAGMSLYQTARGLDHVYFDASVTLLFFLLIGRALDQAMRVRATTAARNLLGSRVAGATVLNPDGSSNRIATGNIMPGMRLLIAAGERIPVDAHLAAGEADIDQSVITGESRPRRAYVGEGLFAGTINLGNAIEVVAELPEDGSLITEIARLMADAEQARGRFVLLADRAAELYAPLVHILGAATFLAWILRGNDWETALEAAIAVLIITCPCALALAVPVTQMVAAGRLFRRGIIIKAADGLERLAAVDTVVMDKTGTLTVGEPRLVAQDQISDETLSLAASVAASSRHPYARAVVRVAGERGVGVHPVAAVTETIGGGLVAQIGDQFVRLGSARHCGLDAIAGCTSSLWLRLGDDPPLQFSFADPLRHDAADAVASLKARGLDVEMLSGDRVEAVADVAKAVGIARWSAGVRPDEKLQRVEDLKRRGHHVLMVGDGLNDAPALAAGDASMSPSTAADISQTTADAIFQGEDLAPIVEALAVARAARRRSIENFAIAIGYNCVFVPLAMMGLVTPLIAAIAMSASSMAVTANALRVALVRAERATP